LADTFELSGSYATEPSSGSPSADPSLAAAIEESVSLDLKELRTYRLDADSVQTVDLGGLDEVNVLLVKAVGGKLKVRLTSTDGTTQAVPVDSFLCIISESVGITAIDLLRETGIEVTAKIFMGQKA